MDSSSYLDARINDLYKDVTISLGLCESSADPCLFRINGNTKFLVVLYVDGYDDGLITATRGTDIEEFLTKLKGEFKITVEPLDAS